MGKKSDRIAGLQSTLELANSPPFIRVARVLANLALKTGLGGEKAMRIVESADQVLSQADILDLPDRFNAAFVDRGWIATSSLSLDVMRAALKSYEAGDTDAGEAIILDWVLMPGTENLLAIMRSKAFNVAQDRWHQLREALALTQEDRYWYAVPLILLASDGFASDVLGTSSGRRTGASTPRRIRHSRISPQISAGPTYRLESTSVRRLRRPGLMDWG